mmetsp:Transcript_962/g.2752  ORF Transcript_962/g.2752 Transcript_962/m.2752 type:complete len:463 (-) Transcript_962:3-1391(-)
MGDVHEDAVCIKSEAISTNVGRVTCSSLLLSCVMDPLMETYTCSERAPTNDASDTEPNISENLSRNVLAHEAAFQAFWGRPFRADSDGNMLQSKLATEVEQQPRCIARCCASDPRSVGAPALTKRRAWACHILAPQSSSSMCSASSDPPTCAPDSHIVVASPDALHQGRMIPLRQCRSLSTDEDCQGNDHHDADEVCIISEDILDTLREEDEVDSTLVPCQKRRWLTLDEWVGLVQRPVQQCCTRNSKHLSVPGTQHSYARGPCFAVTGKHISGAQRQTLLVLGFGFSDGWSSEVTHLVADEFRRTTKMMCAICSGARVVTAEYIDACGKSGSLVDDTDYILRDADRESTFAVARGLLDYSVAAAIQHRAKVGPLLHGLAVHCMPSVKEREDMRLIVTAAGGKWLRRLPPKASKSSVLVLGERSLCTARERERRRATTVHEVELLREAACTQTFRFDAHLLN